MLRIADAALIAWSPPIGVTLGLLFAGLLYVRGWMRVRSAFPEIVRTSWLVFFLTGLTSVWIAIASPLSVLDDSLLSVHMVQHVLLMAVAPPLILLGAPALPLLHGFGARIRRGIIGPILRWKPIKALGHVLAHPLLCWLGAMLALVAWHLPALFELGLRSDGWHKVEHACFLLTGLSFWWPAVQPWPSVARWPRWSMPAYLFLATLPCDVLSALLAFSDRVVYPAYLSTPRPFELSPLRDQQLAGALMWVCVSFVYLIPAVIIALQILWPDRSQAVGQVQPPRGKAAHVAF